MDLHPIWLIRFRFAVILGQSLILLAAWILKSHEIFNIPILLILAVELQMNFSLIYFRRSRVVQTGVLTGGVLAIDTLLLTLILFFSGGVMNPYTIFYLVEVAAAAVLLNAAWTWTCVAWSMICYGSLFFIPPAGAMAPMPGMPDSEFRLHLDGMLTSFFVAAICVAYFITLIQRDRARIRQQLDAAQEKTARMQRFTALTAIAAGAAHELATPLGTIALAAGELRRQIEPGGLPAHIAEDIELIQSQIRRCRSILDQMDPAGPGHNEFNRLTIEQIMERLIRRFPPESAGRFNVSRAADDRQYLVPESRLLQSLAALVQNAIEASLPESPIEISAISDQTHLIFAIRDHGAGLTTEVRDRIGEPFYSTKSGGRGLGLFLARQMMEQYGGNLRMESGPGGGACMSLEFPLNLVA